MEIHLPERLWSAFRSVLMAEGLIELAKEGAPLGKVHGGAASDDARRHFACRFGVSSARMMLVVGQPSPRTVEAHSAVHRHLSGGRVLLVDLACGTGAASLGLVAGLAEERRNGRAPRLPLYVHVLGFDFSEEALRLFGQMAEEVRQRIDDDGIRLSWEVHQANLLGVDEIALPIVDAADTHAGAAALLACANVSGRTEGVSLGEQRDFQEARRFCEHSLVKFQGMRLFVEPGWPDGERNRITKAVEKIFGGLPQLVFGGSWWDEIQERAFTLRVAVTHGNLGDKVP